MNNSNHDDFSDDNSNGGVHQAPSIKLPKNMAEALDWDDPYEALLLLSAESSKRATSLSKDLALDISNLVLEIPDIIVSTARDIEKKNNSDESKQVDDDNDDNKNNNNNSDMDPVSSSIACADSILNSLTKIASGGSQASQEIRQLEEEKREIEEHAQDVETALLLRKSSDAAAESFSSRKYLNAAQAIHHYREIVIKKDRLTARARAYAGDYTIQQLETTQKGLRTTLLEQYEDAVQKSDLQLLGNLTPLLQLIELEQEAVALYLRYLQTITSREMMTQQQQQQLDQQPPPYTLMGKVYNCAVSTLRHHLPMVSHCLHKANGDAAVVQLVHVQVEKAVIPLFQRYVRDHDLQTVSRNARRVYSLLEDRYSNGGGDYLLHLDEDTDANDVDCGFSADVGSLADIDKTMEEAALCLQHAESYTRFIQHTTREVNKARELRFKREQNERRVELERQEWATGMSDGNNSSSNNNSPTKNTKEEIQQLLKRPYEPVQILPPQTQLHEIMAELGGYYSGIERCLLLASMQRAFVADAAAFNHNNNTDANNSAMVMNDYCTPLSKAVVHMERNSGGSGGGTFSSSSMPGGASSSGENNNTIVASRAQQTALVETCLYTTRRSTERAFATGHTGTCSAMANFATDCLGGVLLQVLSQRVEQSGVAKLKPGEGLLVGSAGIFNASNLLLRQSAAAATVVEKTRKGQQQQKQQQTEAYRKRQIQQQIAYACATFNDMEVAIHHTKQLENLLAGAVERGFPPDCHGTEQLKMCVRSLNPIIDQMQQASMDAIESLVSVCKPRIRAIVGEAVGSQEKSAATSFMTGVGGAGKATGMSSVTARMTGGGGFANMTNNTSVRMDYNLDEETYQLLQLSEGYTTRLCSLLDELILPMQIYLAPRLWDSLLLGVLGATAKRLEASIRKCQFTALGALQLDSDMRDLCNYSKDRLASSELNGSNIALCRACLPLGRLLQISKLLNVDDLEDVIDLISASKRKKNWDIKLDDTKTFLCLRQEFESSKIHELLRMNDSSSGAGGSGSGGGSNANEDD